MQRNVTISEHINWTGLLWRKAGIQTELSKYSSCIEIIFILLSVSSVIDDKVFLGI